MIEPAMLSYIAKPMTYSRILAPKIKRSFEFGSMAVRSRPFSIVPK